MTEAKKRAPPMGAPIFKTAAGGATGGGAADVRPRRYIPLGGNGVLIAMAMTDAQFRERMRRLAEKARPIAEADLAKSRKMFKRMLATAKRAKDAKRVRSLTTYLSKIEKLEERLRGDPRGRS